jgi:drug/metabolite transporter (DMT)-like permease
MLKTELSAVVFGLGSALSWGAGDFSGGLATKKMNAFAVILWIELIGVAILASLALFFGESLPGGLTLFYAGCGGVCGALGLACLYKGLAEGRMGVVAPLSAVLAAVIPIIAAALTEGLPASSTLIGFVAALAAVWLLSSEPGRIGLSLETLRLPLLAGLGFGLYFVFIEAAAKETVYWPLVAARLTAVFFIAPIVFLRRGGPASVGRLWPFILLAGVFDSGGNALFALAAQAGRLDVSAVLASLYPAATVLLAMIFLKEHPQKRHWAGLAAALVALTLISH